MRGILENSYNFFFETYKSQLFYKKSANLYYNFIQKSSLKKSTFKKKINFPLLTSGPPITFQLNRCHSWQAKTHPKQNTSQNKKTIHLNSFNSSNGTRWNNKLIAQLKQDPRTQLAPSIDLIKNPCRKGIPKVCLPVTIHYSTANFNPEKM